ncbi:hypothetical protein EDD37DRAFT_151284 [Exophiala viscosa]|uniref:uncharacterized protein n=1 Tax=Exophiala viscosa TaxID=2486360 RepID=UPI002199F372|nr:hypothetical protein EDD37DRAFT_151284 [Exophiala viscosa]
MLPCLEWFICLCVVFPDYLHAQRLQPRVPQATQVTGGSSTPSLTPTTTTAGCPLCSILTVEYEEWKWPETTHSTLATIIYYVNSQNETSTSTSYAVFTDAYGSQVPYATGGDSAFWSSILTPPGPTAFNILNGTPTVTLTTTVSTAPGKVTTITTAMPSPSWYENYGFVAATESLAVQSWYTETLLGTPVTSAECVTTGSSSEFALTPYSTLLGNTDPYQFQVPFSYFSQMVQPSLNAGCVIAAVAFAYTELPIVSALTATTTQYGDFVASQISSPSSQHSSVVPIALSSSTSVSSASATLTTSSTTSAPTTTSRPAITTSTVSLVSTTPISTPTSGQSLGPSVVTSSLAASTTTPPSTYVSETAGVTTPIGVLSTSLTPGGPPVTIDGTQVSLAPSGTALIVGSSTLVPFVAGSSVGPPGESSSTSYGSTTWSAVGGTSTELQTYGGSATVPSLPTYTGWAGSLLHSNKSSVVMNVVIIILIHLLVWTACLF